MNKDLALQMRKFTDDDIRGAMVYCVDFDSCNINCPFHNKKVDCASIISKYSFDLIKRKDEQINGLIAGQETLQKHLAEKNAEIERYKGVIRLLEKDVETAKDEAIKEFADTIHTEIHKALESNYKARKERVDKLMKDPNAYIENDFIRMCEGKILALRGIDDFIDETLKEMVK